jgi:demethylmenaquinone methyltransferase/2-methoxy-6-polyprenyl-1,4-benzoquinol methylase
VVTYEKKIWGDKQRRHERLEAHVRQSKSADFGYHKVPEAEKARQVLRHFNSVARYYDFMNTLLSFGIHHLWKRSAVKWLSLRPGDRVIDVCGGTGDLAILAARMIGLTGRVTLYDINRAMINAGRYKIERSIHNGRICYVQGDAEEISFPDHSFDAAMVGFGIRNLTHLEKGFQEVYRVLKPGGKMMCLEFSKPTSAVFCRLYDFYSFYIMPRIGEIVVGNRRAYTHLPETIRLFPLAQEIADILKKIGFAQVAYRRLTNGIAVIHMAKKS